MGITATGEDELVDDDLVWSPAAPCYVGLSQIHACVRARAHPWIPLAINKDEGSRRRNFGGFRFKFGTSLGTFLRGEGSKSVGCIFKSVPKIHREVCLCPCSKSFCPWLRLQILISFSFFFFCTFSRAARAAPPRRTGLWWCFAIWRMDLNIYLCLSAWSKSWFRLNQMDYLALLWLPQFHSQIEVIYISTARRRTASRKYHCGILI